eukprot:TRINITY_DN942_c0_g1_i1.p1 TRINITY_DN942_c0_g1~~TRINITY_DN942_c0_g1_i1.p1  ORF type:complete len:635 (+),score=143.10 TRINITY_DN942_c0_g1_i1:114-2018(+)
MSIFWGFIALLLINCSHAIFYLPGVAPKEFLEGDEVELKVQKISSSKNLLPYNYYSLPFCEPEDGVKSANENFGEILRGDRIENSPYKLFMKKEERCKVLCVKDYTVGQAKDFSKRINKEFRIQWIIDNLPAARKRTIITADGEASKTVLEKGFPIGFRGDAEKIPGTADDDFCLHNHVRLTILYHSEPAYDGYRVVGFEVAPYSVEHKFGKDNKLETCDPETGLTLGLPYQRIDRATSVVWTYDVHWEYSDVKWASRWDAYLMMADTEIHWFSIMNSVMVVLTLSVLFGMVMLRTLRRDLHRYNQLDDVEDIQEETGWKLVHGDVFRPPTMPLVLSVLYGTGVQLLVMLFMTLVFAVLGFLSPANRGGLGTALIVLFVFTTSFAGYYSARLYKLFHGFDWKFLTAGAVLGYPGFVFLTYFLMNFWVWSAHSTGAVPFGTMCAIFGFWVIIAVPLTFVGSYFGLKKAATEPPVRTNQIPRQIPVQVWYMRPFVSIAVSGVLPFGAIFIELFFILSSLWQNQFYYLFGFLFVVFLILVILCAQISIVMTYFQLCAEDYRWWWRSFLSSGSSGIYMFLYSIVYYNTNLEVTDTSAAVLFFSYSLIMSVTFFLVTGAVGLFSSYWFVSKIYKSIRID